MRPRLERIPDFRSQEKHQSLNFGDLLGETKHCQNKDLQNMHFVSTTCEGFLQFWKINMDHLFDKPYVL